MFGIDTLAITIVAAVFVGALLLLSGVLVGVWLSKGNVEAVPQPTPDLMSLMTQLSQLTNAFSGDFSTHQKMLSDVSVEFEKIGAESGSAEVREMIDRMNAANRRLNFRLQEVQNELDAKALEVNNLISESRTDVLTTLPNRRAFNEEMNRRTSEVARYGGELSFVIIDVDHFKKFNDTYGHLVGDEVLQTVAAVLKATVRDSDFPARMGGEEFGVIMTSTGIQEAAQGAERIRKAIQTTALKIQGASVSITASFGVTEVSEGETPDQVVDQADKALYAAKEGGRNCVWISDAENSLKPYGTSAVEESAIVPAKMKNVCESLRNRLIRSVND